MDLSLKLVPGTLTPKGTDDPSTTGPSIFVQAGNFRANNPQPIVSIKQFLAVSSARSDSLQITNIVCYFFDDSVVIRPNI